MNTEFKFALMQRVTADLIDLYICICTLRYVMHTFFYILNILHDYFAFTLNNIALVICLAFSGLLCYDLNIQVID